MVLKYDCNKVKEYVYIIFELNNISKYSISSPTFIYVARIVSGLISHVLTFKHFIHNRFVFVLS